MSLELVLAGLAGKDDDKGETQLVKDGILDGKGDAALVGTEVDAAGGSPADGIAADGLADAEGEGGGERGHRAALYRTPTRAEVAHWGLRPQCAHGTAAIK